MILLVTWSGRASEFANAVKAATGESMVIAESLARATTLLREHCYFAVVLDQHLLETKPHEADTMLEHLDTAVPVYVNLAIGGMERLVREVRCALERRRSEEARARQAVVGRFQSELNGTLTALLLSVELALETGGMPTAATEKLLSIHELLKRLTRQLGSVDCRVEFEHSCGGRSAN